MYLALSRAPRLLAQLWLAVLAAKLLWDAGKTLPRETLTLVPMVNSCIGLLVPVAIYLTEAWAGACIALSLLAYPRDRYRAGAVWGLAALFARASRPPTVCLPAVWLYGAGVGPRPESGPWAGRCMPSTTACTRGKTCSISSRTTAST